MPDTPTALPTVQGHCPACGWTTLFLADGGYITCSLRECPEPDAASALLEHDPRRSPAPAETCDASTPGVAGAQPLGPCILRAGHDGPVHQDTNGAKWWPADSGPVPGARPAAEILSSPDIVQGRTPDLGQQARETVGTVTRAQLNDAIRTLARLDPAWWHAELAHMARMESRTNILGRHK